MQRSAPKLLSAGPKTPVPRHTCRRVYCAASRAVRLDVESPDRADQEEGAAAAAKASLPLLGAAAVVGLVSGVSGDQVSEMAAAAKATGSRVLQVLGGAGLISATAAVVRGQSTKPDTPTRALYNGSDHAAAEELATSASPLSNAFNSMLDMAASNVNGAGGSGSDIRKREESPAVSHHTPKPGSRAAAAAAAAAAITLDVPTPAAPLTPPPPAAATSASAAAAAHSHSHEEAAHAQGGHMDWPALDQLGSEVEGLQRLKQQLERDLQSMQMETEDYVQKILDAEYDAEAATAMAHDAEGRWRSTAEALQRQLKANSHLRAENEALHAEVARLTGLVESKGQVDSRAERQLAGAEKKVAAIKAQLEVEREERRRQQLIAGQLDKQVAAMQLQADQQQQRLAAEAATLSAQVAAAERKAEEAVGLFEAQKGRSAVLEKAWAQAKQDVEALREKVRELELVLAERAAIEAELAADLEANKKGQALLAQALLAAKHKHEDGPSTAMLEKAWEQHPAALEAEEEFESVLWP